MLTERRLGIDGISCRILATAFRPDLPWLVLLHGLGASSDYLRALATELDGGFNLLIPDLPGCGESTLPGAQPSLASLADTLARLLHQEGLERFVAVGHSLGGQIALELLERDMAGLRGAVLLAPTVNSGERRGVAQLLRLVQDMLYEPPRVVLGLMRDYCRCGLPDYLRLFRASLLDRPESKARSSRLPVLIARGSLDRLVPDRWVAALAAAAPHRLATEIDGARHGVVATHPRECARLIRAFVDGHCT